MPLSGASCAPEFHMMRNMCFSLNANVCYSICRARVYRKRTSRVSSKVLDHDEDKLRAHAFYWRRTSRGRTTDTRCKHKKNTDEHGISSLGLDEHRTRKRGGSRRSSLCYLKGFLVPGSPFVSEHVCASLNKCVSFAFFALFDFCGVRVNQNTALKHWLGVLNQYVEDPRATAVLCRR